MKKEVIKELERIEAHLKDYITSRGRDQAPYYICHRVYCDELGIIPKKLPKAAMAALKALYSYGNKQLKKVFDGNNCLIMKHDVQGPFKYKGIDRVVYPRQYNAMKLRHVRQTIKFLKNK